MHAVNVPVCFACAHRRAGTCTLNGRDIALNARDSACPGGFFPGQPNAAAANVVAPAARVDDWPTRGPALWADLHRTALAGNLTPEWLAAFRLRIGCGACLQHWDAEVAAHPPDLGSAEAAFVWTVERHSAVSARLGKPTLTPEAARRIWGR